MKNIKSQAHIEVILSLILFVTSILLIFYFVNPLAKTEDINPSAERVIRIVMENLTYEFGRLGIVVKAGNCIVGNAPCCYYFGPTAAHDPNLYGPATLKYVETYSNIDNKKINIYFSNKFPSSIIPNYNNPCGQPFWFGEFQNESLIYNNRTHDVARKGIVDFDYQELKTDLRINYDFSFNVTTFDKVNQEDLSFNRRIPQGIQVVAREFPIRVINNSGHINEYILNIRVW
ncbi:hypothetical protein GOV12_01990 [Candidatus Pacearchaeota archaeon]|nr:hypothetical protein [Candidatus Pacearchaeota archaeon]